MAAGVFILVSVVSEGIARSNTSGEPLSATLQSILNLIGPFGRKAGVALNSLMGWSALVPVAWVWWLAISFWNYEETKSRIEVDSRVLPLVGIFLLFLFSAILAFVFWGAAGGGAAGVFIGDPLLRFFGPVGASIISAAFILAALSLGLRQSIGAVLKRIFHFSKHSAFYGFMVIPVVLIRSISAVLYVVAVIFKGICRAVGRFWESLFTVRTFGPKNPLDEIEDEDEEEVEQVLPRPRKKASDYATLRGTKAEDEISTEEEEDYSHVVVMRRKPSGGVLSAEKKGRKKAENEDEDLAWDSAQDFSGYKRPSTGLLQKGEAEAGGEDDEELLQKSKQIEAKLKDFSILGRVTEVHPGPVITLFEFEPAAGVKVGKIAALQDDLAMSLRAASIRIIAPIPKKGTVGIEVPNRNRDLVRLRDVLESPEFMASESILNVPLGKDTYGDPVFVDISHMPHLLIAGATGTGKSVCINALLLSLLYRASPSELGLILIDPKILELSVYEGIPHLRVPVVTVPKQAKAVLDWAIKEMERRYRVMQRFGVRNVDGYNRIVAGTAEPEPVRPKRLDEDIIVLREDEVIEAGTIDPEEEGGSPIAADPRMFKEELKPLPKIVIVIDELADLMLTVGRDIEELVTRLAQKARAAGIHLIVATQRPSVDVITGLIKANFPARLSFRVTSRIDSRTILDSMGAERLLGRGDMLFMQPGSSHLRRIHGAFVADSEVKRVVDSIKATAQPCYDQRIMDLCQRALEEDSEGTSSGGIGDDEFDSFYDKAVELVVQKGQASTSMIQRAFRIGYNRAARIIEMMEKEGVIGPMDGVKPREVLAQSQEEFER